MIIKSKEKVNKIKGDLLERLREERSFWSYEPKSVSLDNMEDWRLIALTMRYLDLDDIKLLFDIFPYKMIKAAWREHLVPEGEYLYTLNRFFAWYYFKAKNPDAYLKTLQTRHLNTLYS